MAVEDNGFVHGKISEIGRVMYIAIFDKPYFFGLNGTKYLGVPVPKKEENGRWVVGKRLAFRRDNLEEYLTQLINLRNEVSVDLNAFDEKEVEELN
jgi:hypothetical protein